MTFSHLIHNLICYWLVHYLPIYCSWFLFYNFFPFLQITSLTQLHLIYLLTLLPLNYFTLFTLLEVLLFWHLQSFEFTKSINHNRLAVLSLAQLSPSLFVKLNVSRSVYLSTNTRLFLYIRKLIHQEIKLRTKAIAL